jgi:3-isopropylmalate/(R)-2-methylmalate dehydratase small subunit
LFEALRLVDDYRLRVDVDAQTVSTPAGETLHFEIDAFRKHCLLNGLDEIGLTLQHADEIRAFEQRRRACAPWLFD